ncbi:MAG: histidinol-phosphatase [Desulfosarcina sp.]|nr:histidinol-phosphatase [Desulfosarcina sp.]
MNVPYLVSIHGGHSGQFCGHAQNTLEEIILAYIDQGYFWVGITEHMPPTSDAFVYPEEKSAGLDARALKERFAVYMTTCREFQAKYANDIRIYVGFETEDYRGSIDFAKALITAFSPDYVVGSVHHVKDIPFDYSKGCYDQAIDCCGGLDGLYACYFDQQYEMIQALKPRVVGHLDGLILDFNLRPLSRGGDEPYLSAPILKKACEMRIDIVPGDDSHGVDTIGSHMHRAIGMLRAAGLSTAWRKPVDEP